MEKKVLHFKLSSSFFRNNGITTGFLENGFTVTEFEWQSYRYQFGIEMTRAKFVQLAQQTKADIIFMQIQDGEILDIETIKQLSQCSFVVNYTFDCRIKEKTQWLYDLAPHIGLTLFSNYEDVQICHNEGIYNVHLMQSSCDMDVYKTSDINLGVDVPEIVFFGQNYVGTNLDFPLAQERLNMVDFLRQNYNGKFWPYGMGWGTELIDNAEKEVFVYNNCKVAINQNNFDRLGYTSDRIWRAMASGAFVLSKHFEGIEGLFQVGIHLETWKTFQELNIKLKQYLADDEKRIGIAKAGQDYVRQYHSYTNRVKSLEHIIVKYDHMGVFAKNWGHNQETKVPIVETFTDVELPIVKVLAEGEVVHCLYGHTVNGQFVGNLDFQYEEAVCDCKKIKWSKERCGCTEPHDELVQRENPNY